MPRAFAASNRTLAFVLLCLLLVCVSPASLRAAEPIKIYPTTDINSGDTAWMLTSAALVLMMTGPGLALFYSGLVRRKNVLGTMMQSFILMAVVSVLWAIVGYSLAFDVGNPFIGGLHFAFLRGVGPGPCDYAPTIPHTTWMAYQMMFAIITPALICGAYAERMKFSSMLIFSSLWLLVVYCPMAHMVWGKGGLFNVGVGDAPQGRFAALDFAGGTVVHISSGVSALICALVLGKRRGYGRVPMPPHSVVLSVIGAALLWVGWFGFNGGSALAANGLASSAFIATHFAAAAATLGWMFVEWIKTGKPTVLGAISGAVAGLVVITPASGFTTPMYAIIMGFIGGAACFFSATTLKHMFGFDDALDAFGVHGVGGTIGALLTGVFSVAAINTTINNNKGIGGVVEGNYHQLLSQFLAVLLTYGIAIVGSFILIHVTRILTKGLRLSESDEYDGMDLTQHGESGYNFEEAFPATMIEDAGPTLLHHGH
ncbi:MAG TPA: ammonium transporter [Tepidisphaeraceae bacterium]|jgi:Amt family ammonium transporter|nr:ammonium transporter [Tepidisphaeraceae bacterium]